MSRFVGSMGAALVALTLGCGQGAGGGGDGGAGDLPLAFDAPFTGDLPVAGDLPFTGDMPVQQCTHTCPMCAMDELCAPGTSGLQGFQGHRAACLKRCNVTSDCPPGMRCAELYSEFAMPTPLCVSDVVPPRCEDRAFDPSWHCDFPPARCLDADTLYLPFSEPKNQTCGHERIHCPNGCAPPQGMTEARCR